MQFNPFKKKKTFTANAIEIIQKQISFTANVIETIQENKYHSPLLQLNSLKKKKNQMP